MNYIDDAREELGKHIKVGKGLMRVYTVLVLVKGEETTLEDVHDAWAVNINETWDREANGDHWSIIPFDQLKPETQAKDQSYVDAIRETARALKDRNHHFIYIQPQIFTKDNGDWGTSYDTDYHKSATLEEAINHGFSVLDHDDFWVGEMTGDKLVAIYHSDGKKRPIENDDDREEFNEVQEAI